MISADVYDDDWYQLRNERMDYDDGECQDCGCSATQVHHLRYPAFSIWDCVSLCNDCHLIRHNRTEWY